jgi:hypothetical protein
MNYNCRRNDEEYLIPTMVMSDNVHGVIAEVFFTLQLSPMTTFVRGGFCFDMNLSGASEEKQRFGVLYLLTSQVKQSLPYRME